MNQGGICIGCTMPGFPDKFSPFYQEPPGATVSTATSTNVGKLVRFLRRMTQVHQNRESLWDKVGDTPSGWALEKEDDPLFGKFSDYVYRKLQFLQAVRPGRWRPETKYRDGFTTGTEKRDLSELKGTPLKWGQARRREKLEREGKGFAA